MLISRSEGMFMIKMRLIKSRIFIVEMFGQRGELCSEHYAIG